MMTFREIVEVAVLLALMLIFLFSGGCASVPQECREMEASGLIFRSEKCSSGIEAAGLTGHPSGGCLKNSEAEEIKAHCGNFR